ncbi:hypothetical protein N9N67_05070 [Bacteriovoracaceae bacterium]|nr:hypothetical protein [Bacteriovoracaceae bacterium]
MLTSKNLITLFMIFTLTGLFQSCGKGSDASKLVSGGGGSSSGSTKVSTTSGGGSSSSNDEPLFYTFGASEFSSFWIDGANKGAAGDNSYGVMGIGSDSDGPFNTPQAVDSVETFKAVEGGKAHSCFLNSDNQLYCAGWNFFGQLGLGAASNSEYTSPQLVDSSNTYKQFVGGTYHTCGIRSNGSEDGKVYCWGMEGNGRLGNNCTDPCVTFQKSPLAVDTAELFVDVTAGDAHSCGISILGKVFCWGSNSKGQLGNSDLGVTLSKTPIEIDVDAAATFSSISSTLNHTCAIRSDSGNVGKVMCWGRNNQGQIGNGSGDDEDVETPVLVSSGTTNIYSQICVGGNHTCGIEATVSGDVLTDTGEIKCWGDAGRGQIGNGAFGDANDEQLTADYVLSTYGASDTAITEDYLAVICGNKHTCASTESDYFCWGENQFGALGNGSLNDGAHPGSSYEKPQKVDAIPSS